MMMIGGTKETSYRQFRVNPNSMSVEVLDDLPFPFDYGSCHEYNEDFALACAGADNKERGIQINILLSNILQQYIDIGNINNIIDFCLASILILMFQYQYIVSNISILIWQQDKNKY